jgi:penicillin-binding protein 1A
MGAPNAQNRRGGARPPPRRPARPRRRWTAMRLLNLAAVAAVWCAVGMLGLVAWWAYDLPDVRGMNVIKRRPAVTLLTANGAELVGYGDQYGEPVRLSDLPWHLPWALIAAEDRRFYRHHGVDPLALLRAAAANVRAFGLVQGGSTITQQLAKNVFLSPERTLKRKVQELLLSFWLEAEFSKEQILEIYLNRVYFGAGTFGVTAAAQRYFDKPASELTLSESAMLVGLLKAPTRYAPTNDLATAQNRARLVLATMTNLGFIDPQAAELAQRKPARLAHAGGPPRNVRYFGDWVMDEINDYIGRRDEDLVVHTTLDLRLQQAAERIVGQAIADHRDHLGVNQAALVAMLPDGSVKAMVGGRDYRESVYNRATQARRQPGSAFKLFVYAAALESGLDGNSLFEDRPISIGKWRPRNFDDRYFGTVTMNDALARSLNTVAVQITEKVGRDKVAEVAARMGVSDHLTSHPSLALGASEVGLLPLVGAYAALANGGTGVLPHAILEIRGRDGRVLYRRDGSGPGRALDPAVVARLNVMFANVIENGTGRGARIDRPAGGKTGTSQDFRDAWFVGYTAELVTGVWFGNDDGTPMRRVTGAGLPARVWRNFMLDALKGEPPRPLPVYADDSDQQGLWRKILAQFGAGVTPPSLGPYGHPLGAPPRDN